MEVVKIPKERFDLSLQCEEEAGLIIRVEEERRLLSEYDLRIVACLYNSSPEEDRRRLTFMEVHAMVA